MLLQVLLLLLFLLRFSGGVFVAVIAAASRGCISHKDFEFSLKLFQLFGLR
jgi:hypothetical protein